MTISERQNQKMVEPKIDRVEDGLHCPFLFYRTSVPPSLEGMVLPADYEWYIWKPSYRHIMPAALEYSRQRFAFRWLMHQLHLFSNRDYQVLIIQHLPSREVVHYSGTTGRYWRWPFMGKNEMQIGDTWTHPNHRGRGLARFALVQLLRELTPSHPNIWYVTELENPVSIAVAEAAGMTLAGKGVRTRPRVLRFLHAYRMLN